ncbi:hypothetical protein [Acidimangrovimonas pyrenivorans]|uniref:Endolysin n=1 Tax=Acidimangrovimonas pyrenivorans TaxID=2030798 RepID=A0ABV7AN32_9RHOB
MSYRLSPRSLGNLSHVHPDLVDCIKRAIQVTEQDFGVPAPAARTAKEQHKLFLAGRSQKDGYRHKSNHQITADGTGHAADLVPWDGARFAWDWPLIYPVAAAMAQAGRDMGTRLRWGGNWYECLTDSCHSAADAAAAVARYKVKHPGPDFIDGPHFELLP